MLKIFHTADIHLDSPFSSLSPACSEARRVELRRTFKQMIDYARTEDADMILIPGDLFDCSFISRDTADLLAECFSSVDCPVVICPGNHDPYTSGSIYASGKLPANVHIFSSEEPSCFDFEALGVAVWGAAFTRERYEGSVLASIKDLRTDKINILCQHGDTRSPLSQKAPLSPRDIAYRGFVYAALGHIHVPPEPAVIGNTTVAYPGCPVGRSFDDPGFGGALMVLIDGGEVKTEKIIFSKHRYMTELLDITGCESDERACELLTALICERGYGEETSLRVTLEGAVTLNYRPDTAAIAKCCKGELPLLEVRESTMPCYDAAYLEDDLSLRGALYRILAEKMREGNEYDRHVAAEALRAGLAALDGRQLF